MKNRIFSLLMACIMLLAVLPFSAFAESVNSCSITVNCSYDGRYIKDAKVNIFRIAEVTEKGKIPLVGNFSNYRVIIDPSSAGTLQTSAITLDAYAQADKIIADYSGFTGNDGNVKFENLPVGVYLVSVDEIKNEDGSSYEFEPYILFLPYADSEKSEPVYDVTTNVKANLRPKQDLSYIHILVTWDDKDFLPLRPETVIIRLICDGEVYDTIEVGAKDNWEYTWENIDPNHEWTVVEDGVDVKYVVDMRHPDQNDFVINNKRVEKVFIPIIPIIPIPGCIVPVIVVTSAIVTPIVIKEILDHTTTKPQPTTEQEEEEQEEEVLPYTGALWWPVPVLLCTGFALILIGNKSRKKDEEV